MKNKKNGISKIQLLVGILALVMLLISILGYSVNKSETPVHLESVIDGDTVRFNDGRVVSLLGVNTDENGQDNATLSALYLKSILDGRNVWLEYDHYEKNLAWIWVGCESKPKFLTSDLMIRMKNSNNESLQENPIGCKKGALVNEQIIKMGWSKVYFLSKKEETKYGRRLYSVIPAL